MEFLVVIFITIIILGAMIGGKSFGGTIQNGFGCLIFIVIFILFLLWVIPSQYNSVSNETTESSIQVEQPHDSAHVIECEGAKPAGDLVMDVIGDEHLLYTLPDDKASAVINSKLSEISGKTEYHQIDTSTRVKIHCDKGEWVFVQLTIPEWMTDVKGWTKREYLQPYHAPVGEPTKAIDSNFKLGNFSQIYTSVGLTKADLAWHAIGTYGFDCSEVIFKGEITKEGRFLIKCSSGLKLWVRSRNDQHPLITDK